MLIRDSILPLGSVVKLAKQPGLKYMITGYFVIVDQILFDYCGVHYPLGEEKDSITVPFNRSDIEELLFEGYRNEQTEILFDELERIGSLFSTEIDKGELKYDALQDG